MKRFILAAGALWLGTVSTSVQSAQPPPSAVRAMAPATRTVYLVRHGHYAPDPTIDERTGPALSPIGLAQARLAGARLGALPARFDGLYASPMQRARDTAAVIAADLEAQRFSEVDDLAECTPPTRDAAATAKETPAALASCKARFDRAFARFFAPATGPDRSDLLVCHGNVIRSMVVRALGVDADAWLAMSIGHASITRIRVQPDGSFKVVAVGDVGHLPNNLLTGASGDPERSLSVPELRQARAE